MLARPGPLTATDVALALDHETVEDPGATQLPGLVAIEALTEADAVTVNVADWVTGPP
jgi:hypothetical protein